MSPEKKELEFEDALKELNELVSSMENNQLPLQKMIDGYERGSKLIKHCKTLLKNARNRLELIKLSPNEKEEESYASSTKASEKHNIDPLSREQDEIRLL